jgi:ribosomal protein L11 methyltransferase
VESRRGGERKLEQEMRFARCGTGILSIIASKLSASKITCFDIEDWAMENTRENFEVNDTRARIFHGSIDALHDQSYDVILANINKKVLLDQMKYYAAHLKSGGILMVSGFYLEDLKNLAETAGRYRLKKIGESVKNNRALLILGN